MNPLDPNAAQVDRPNLPAVHRASGELSVALASEEVAVGLGSPKKKYAGRPRRQSLWGVGGDRTLEELEIQRKQDIEREQLERQLAEEAAAEEMKRIAEEEAALADATSERRRNSPPRSPLKDPMSPGSDLSGDSPAGKLTAEEIEEEMREAQDQLAPIQSPSKFKSKPFRHHLLQVNPLLLTSEENRDVTSEITHSLQELMESKAREQLQSLARFVKGHTSRKVQTSWNMLETRFKSSPHTKIVMVPDRNGILQAVKHPAIYASVLTSMLCSSRVKMGHQELHKLLTVIGAQEDQILLARQIAALNVVVTICQEAQSDLVKHYTDEMFSLLHRETFLISQQELEDAIFSDEPEKRAKELEDIRANRHFEVQAMLEEKRRKDEKKESIAAGRRKLVDEFEKILGSAQLFRGIMNVARVDLMCFLVESCHASIVQYYDDQTSKVPLDLCTFLGIDVFPPVIQEKIRIRLAKLNAPKTAASDQQPRASMMRRGVNSNAGSRLQSTQNSFLLAAESNDGNDSVTSSAMFIDTLNQHSHNQIPVAAMGLLDDIDDPVRASVTPVKLAGPPRPVLQCLRDMVAIGKTFPGVSYREAVEMMQYIAVTKISGAFRGFIKRWRFMRARHLWRTKYRAIQDRHFKHWSRIVRTFVHLRHYTMRKVVAWRYYTKYTQRRRLIFQTCFWPLYTWRKYAAAGRRAKEKTKFLVGRVMPTLLQMKVFRAWRDYAQGEHALKAIADACMLQKRRAKGREYLRFLHRWARQKRMIRKAWIRQGHTMQTRHLVQVKQQLWMIWRSFTWIRKYSRERCKTEMFAFRAALFGGNAATVPPPAAADTHTPVHNTTNAVSKSSKITQNSMSLNTASTVSVTSTVSATSVIMMMKKPWKKPSLTERRLLASSKRREPDGGESGKMQGQIQKVKSSLNKRSMIVGNAARKTAAPRIRDASEQEKLLERVLEEMKRRKMKRFTWKTTTLAAGMYVFCLGLRSNMYQSI